ncbi:division/cell wall cluster transcriptional repressor MraZ [Anaerofustis butyriciformans]|uniref:division/cell wall cluster transcriptional repressor MraZ n=1 Tax=Anaerofustis TaxID=264995 RepID=UPI002E35C387|nr:division/cell wall cluster transcriptional repressor MraZ [Anaerofustis sp. HA2171]
MLIGEYNHTVDSKGRVSVPAKFRNELGDSFIMCKGLDKCIWVYPQDAWKELAAKIKSLPTTDRNARRFSRFILGSACECSPDKQGRTNVSQPLREYAGITKDIVVVGVEDKVEIWDKAQWDSFNDMSDDDINDVAQEMYEAGISI